MIWLPGKERKTTNIAASVPACTYIETVSSVVVNTDAYQLCTLLCYGGAAITVACATVLCKLIPEVTKTMIEVSVPRPGDSDVRS